MDTSSGVESVGTVQLIDNASFVAHMATSTPTNHVQCAKESSCVSETETACHTRNEGEFRREHRRYIPIHTCPPFLHRPQFIRKRETPVVLLPDHSSQAPLSFMFSRIPDERYRGDRGAFRRISCQDTAGCYVDYSSLKDTRHAFEIRKQPQDSDDARFDRYGFSLRFRRTRR